MFRTLVGGAVALCLLAVGCKGDSLDPNDPNSVDTSVPKPTSNNEPPGFTPVANRGFTHLEEDNWIWGGEQSAYQEMNDAGAPQSPSPIGRVTMPAGFPSGGSPIHFERNIRPSDHVYLNTWFRLSSNWQSNPIADALIAFWAGDQPRIYWGLRPDSTGAIHPAAEIVTDKVPGGDLWLDPNQQNVTVSLGAWHHVELEIQSVANSDGTGKFVCWFDGTLVALYNNVPYDVVPQGRHWQMLQVGPAWGGITQPLNQNQTLDFDHLYASDSPIQ